MMMRRSNRELHLLARIFVGLTWSAAIAQAQGILTLMPGRTVSTLAGVGRLGYTGDGGNAANAAMGAPRGILYDAVGNLFVADTANHVVRQVTPAGTIVTIAGTGVEGFSGDGGPATLAQLDSPSGLALDMAGDLYIADTRNHRIRKVSGSVITTFAGTGAPGFSGDGAKAVAATLFLPSSVAVDRLGVVYVADTNNQRIRKIASGMITTFAGSGEEGFAGDGALATLASLDSPSGVAVNATGQVYIADRHNQRVRMVDLEGMISTIVGSGSPGFTGSFAGDGASARSASLATPAMISLDQAGNLYIADTGNERIRQVSGDVITTLVGSGEQGVAADGVAAAASALNAPRGLAAASDGSLLIADTLNERLLNARLATLTYGLQMVGTLSNAQSIVIANRGNAPLTVSSVLIAEPFTLTAGGSCVAPPMILMAGSSCTQNLGFLPAAVGSAQGSVSVSATGANPEIVRLSGLGAVASTSVTLISDNPAALSTTPVTFHANVNPIGVGIASGSVTFYDGTSPIGAVQPLSNNQSSVVISTLSAGTHEITAVYSGDDDFSASTASAVSQLIGDFDFTFVSNPANPTGTSHQTIVHGEAAIFTLTISPLAAPFNFPVSLSATGLPPGATVTFSPQIVLAGTVPTSFTMTVQTSQAMIATDRGAPGRAVGASTLILALLFFSIPSSMRHRTRRFHPLAVMLVLIGGGVIGAGLTGCAAGDGLSGQQQKDYQINIIGTAGNPGGGASLQHVASVQLTVR